jgi:hypothetical protein
MTAFSRHSKTGKLQLAIWAGATEPNLTDDALWMDVDEAEKIVAEMADAAAKPNPRNRNNPFSHAGAARIWARWNAAAPGRR